jgi:hypothetical protein
MHHYRKVDFPTADNAKPQVDQLLGVNDSDIAVGFYTPGCGGPPPAISRCSVSSARLSPNSAVRNGVTRVVIDSPHPRRNPCRK